MTFRLVFVVGCLGLLAACAGTQPTYYTLQPPLPSAPMVDSARNWTGFQIRKVTVPSQLDRRSVVLTVPPGAEVRLLNDSLWASPLPDELALALASGLQARLGAAQLADLGGKAPFWRLDVAVQRFESIYGQQAVLELSWAIQAVGFDAPSYRCRWLDVEPAASVPELVAAHRLLQGRLADVLAAQMQGKPVPADGVNRISCSG
ncbi:MAG TPA: PqiC family protein [Alcaligenes sp.]|nr:PqiC family protein [Alcaligenes sp.]HRL27778.1 PqiC family protein [Alcaligenes sp.]